MLNELEFNKSLTEHNVFKWQKNLEGYNELLAMNNLDVHNVLK